MQHTKMETIIKSREKRSLKMVKVFSSVYRFLLYSVLQIDIGNVDVWKSTKTHDHEVLFKSRCLSNSNNDALKTLKDGLI